MLVECATEPKRFLAFVERYCGLAQMASDGITCAEQQHLTLTVLLPLVFILRNSGRPFRV